MKNLINIKVFGYMAILILIIVSCQSNNKSDISIYPEEAEWPRVWTSYGTVESMEKDFKDLKEHGVQVVDVHPGSIDDARDILALARKYNMKLGIRGKAADRAGNSIKDMGFEPINALMIGGVYNGMAVDRFLFKFTPEKHTIIIEPPVYHAFFAYIESAGSELTNAGGSLDERYGHYFPNMPDPVKAEIIVPLKAYDGQQHLKVIPATIEVAPAGTKLTEDSASPEMQGNPEIKNRKLYKLSFDLTGLNGAMLDKVGISPYWEYPVSGGRGIFGDGHVSVIAESTLEAGRKMTREQLEMWSEANGGTFPSDVLIAARVGDEPFYTTSQLYEPNDIEKYAPNKSVNFPLWDYSEPALGTFKKNAGDMEAPRTWGYPEIYGAEAYAQWLYTLHENCATLIRNIVDEGHQIAPELLYYRNTTRAGVFALANDHDGNGPELITREFDIVHLDPYPVGGAWWHLRLGYRDEIPRDLYYYAGLARRYHKPLLAWLQAHVFGGPLGLQHPSPTEISRMCEEVYDAGVDGIKWLGYGPGTTFPITRPESWEAAAEFHKKMYNTPPHKPEPKLAVLRSYNAWSLTSYTEKGVIHPQDWLLQQWLEVWAVKYRKHYDVFELPPAQTAEQREKLKQELKRYDYIISTEPWDNAWLIGEKTIGTVIDPGEATNYQAELEKEMRAKGWLGN